jgi:GT2 family glycosyltransferase
VAESQGTAVQTLPEIRQHVATPSVAAPQADAVTLAYVHNNEVAYSWYFSMLQLWVADLHGPRRLLRGGFVSMRCNSGQLVSARNKAITHFLDGDAPWLLWIDTDMGFDADMLEQLMAAADPVERPIVGALCFGQRELDPDGKGGYHTIATPTIFDWEPIGDLEGFAIRYDYPPNALVRCGGTGSAAILIHRGVFERIQGKYGNEWYHRVPAKEGSIGEDLSFCMRATALDIPIHVHTGVRTTHLKPVWLSEVDFLERSSVPPATEEVAVIVPVLGRPQHAEPFMASLRASTGLARVYAVCQSGDEATAAAWLDAGAEVLESGEQTSFAAKANLGYAKTTQPWVLLVGSDVHFYPGWLDQALAAAAPTGAHVVGTNDCGNPRVIAGEHATHMLIRRAYIDEHGASWDGPRIVAHEGYRHWYVDNEIVTVAKQRGVWAMALASKVEHLHPLWGKAEDDEVYQQGQAHAEQDKALFRQRLAANTSNTSNTPERLP